MANEALDRDGYWVLRGAVTRSEVEHLLQVFTQFLVAESESVRARSSRGHVYAARNLIDSIPEASSVWQSEPLLSFLQAELGDGFGLVRALFFDKPPDRTWALPWHKDTSIAVRDNSVESSSFSRPTIKAGVPHLIASDEVLRRMLTLRIHLDDVTDENGPLQVIPGSHQSSDCEGEGLAAAVPIHAAAGDVLAMRPLIRHSSGSSQPGTRRHRRILHLEFANSERLPDGIEWHDFVTPAVKSRRIAWRSL
jgi:ectoine hydroxylase-related dioxygenase (phytanoyl-CoA dioxygenase family)